MKAPALKPGDTIGIFAPSSSAKREALDAGVAELKRRGFAVKIALDPCAQTNWFTAAAAPARLQALYDLFEDDSVKAIFASRGGYGSMELLPELDFKRLAKNPKWLVGFSDLTTLINLAQDRAKIPTLHGPHVAHEFSQVAAQPEFAPGLDATFKILSGAERNTSFNLQTIRAGEARGKIFGGNLTLIAALLGTPWEFDFRGKILFLEEVGEAPYRVQRMLQQLALAGKFKELAGLVFGDFKAPASASALPSSPNMEQVFRAAPDGVLAGTTYPVLFGLPVGHSAPNLPIPIGADARIEKGILSLEW